MAREDKKLRQLNLAVSAANKGAVKLYEDLGFSVFGTEPNAAFVNGKGYDEHHMQCVL
jgi:RimJ/RimL family protein N-acetyltransferase